ncbi:anti-sigma factor [Rugosimonospora africana]|uniref:Regulator of SigK n=1 Tax=Rugosimonospora africana TaxID=556532 RepID=A0A8J3QWB7_9ACTN|nr:anti-sigma factor [Rugosimonospora africana]GIH17731.1 hypothetical protein Raf01_59030 [Rugosimonospora africana]
MSERVEASDIHTLSGPYALDAVTDIERAAFARHLRECPACAQEVAELTETAGRLSVDAVAEPPARLRARVLDEIGRTRQLGPGAGPGPGRTQPATSTRRWRRWGVAAVAAAAVLLAGGGGALVEHQRVRQSTQAARIWAVVEAPDAVLRTVPGPDGTGRVTLVVSDSRDQAVAVFGGLPSPGADRTYQLWLVDDGRAIGKGTLGTGVTGGSVLMDGVRGEQSFAITNEPAGGSRAPTPPQLATIELT